MEIIQGTKKHNNRPISGATISCNHLNSKGARANELEHDAAIDNCVTMAMMMFFSSDSETRRVEPQRLPHHKTTCSIAGPKLRPEYRNETVNMEPTTYNPDSGSRRVEPQLLPLRSNTTGRRVWPRPQIELHLAPCTNCNDTHHAQNARDDVAAIVVLLFFSLLWLPSLRSLSRFIEYPGSGHGLPSDFRNEGLAIRKLIDIAKTVR